MRAVLFFLTLVLWLNEFVRGFSNNFSSASSWQSSNINEHSKFISSLSSNIHCEQPGSCKLIANAACLGVKLPYNSIYLNPELFRTYDDVEDKLNSLKGISQIPKCWTLIQPFLCALYMPKCQNNSYDLPSQEMCKMLLSPCRFLLLKEEFEILLKCENSTKYQPKCDNNLRELKFNSSGQCQSPLVATDNSAGFYQHIDGCGVSCINPYFTKSEQDQIHQFIAWACMICFLFNLFTVGTFLIEWPTSNKYPSLAIFYINCCYVMACLGWLAQFLPGARDDIICRKDGTLRTSEPSAGENLSCVAIFILVYYFLIAASVWFVIFAYALNIIVKDFGKMTENKKVDKKGAYFHLVAWSLPLVLTITIMALCEIDGNSVTGICFVGYNNYKIRAGFLLGPIFLMLMAGAFFICRGLTILISLQINGHEIIKEQDEKAKIKSTIIRLGLFSLFILVFVIATFMFQIYEFQHHDEWEENFNQYVLCKILKTDNCKMKSRPSLAILQLQLLILFSSGILMSYLVWNNATLMKWQRFIKRLRNSEVEEEIKVKKHKVIAKAYAKKENLHNAGRVSISLHNSREDPLGLNIHLDSNGSQDISTTWAAALPKLMDRRGALIGIETASYSSQRRNSLDSEISISVRRLSFESRRHSLDSQISVQFTEMTATRKSTTAPLSKGSKRFHKKRKRPFTRHHSSHMESIFVRRGSTTSQESQMVIFQNSNINNLPQIMPQPNTKRRPANAGIDMALLTHSMPNQSVDDASENEDETQLCEALLPQIKAKEDPCVKILVDQSTQVSSSLWKITAESSNESLNIFS